MTVPIAALRMFSEYPKRSASAPCHFCTMEFPMTHNSITPPNARSAKQIVLAMLLGATVFGLAAPTRADFMVNPMKIDLMPQPADRVTMPIYVNNTDPNSMITATLAIVEVTQAESGTWQIIEPNSGIDVNGLPSCTSWISLDRNTVQIPPFGSVAVMMEVRVPPRTRGFYVGAILVSERKRPDATGVVVVIRYCVPVLVDIQGRPMRHRVTLDNVALEAIPATIENQATTLVRVDISNNGGTFSRLEPFARIQAFSNDHWFELTKVTFEDLGIFPGKNLKLRKSIDRILPKGRYRLESALFVDGRPVKGIATEVDFVGDPSARKATADLELKLEPQSVFIDSLPGAPRTGAITVQNPSNDPVTIQASLLMHPVLRGMTIGDVKADELSCAGWVTLQPEQFTIRGGSRQGIRIISNMPKEGNPTRMHANYYALLQLRAKYADGQNAGVATTNICITNKKVQSQPAAQAMRPPIIQVIDANSFAVVGRFNNTGNVHFTPKCIATIGKPDNSSSEQYLLSGSANTMLPFEIRDFSRIIDLTDYQPGIYRLRVDLEYGPKMVATTQVPVRIGLEDNQKMVEAITTKEFEAVGAKW